MLEPQKGIKEGVEGFPPPPPTPPTLHQDLASPRLAAATPPHPPQALESILIPSGQVLNTINLPPGNILTRWLMGTEEKGHCCLAYSTTPISQGS